MNKKFAYTPEGIDQLVAYLYSLTQAELDREIQLLLLHYVQWIYRHIDLSDAQFQQLSQLEPDFLFSCQQQLALALRLRAQIRLVKQDRPPSVQAKDSKPGVGKMHGIDFGIQASEAEQGELKANAPGELVYTITYAT